MSFDVVYYAALLISLLAVTLVMAYAWRQRSAAAAAAFLSFMVCVWNWIFFFALQLISTRPEVAWLWERVYMSVIIFIPVGWLVFALTYAGLQRWVRPWIIAVLCILPALNTVFLWTNDLHHLFFVGIHFDRKGWLLFPYFDGNVGMWVHIVYSYLLIAVGMGLLFRVALRSFRLYRAQAIALMMSVVVPLIPNVLFVLGRLRYPLTPFGFTITSLLLGWAIFRYQLLDLRPVARDMLVESMKDAMLVLDKQHRIVDINPAMVDLLKAPTHQVVGQSVTAVSWLYQDWGERFVAETVAQAEIAVTHDGDPHVYDLHISPLADRRGRTTGSLVILRDITQRKQAENALRQYAAELEASNAELDAFAHTVAHDLKSPLATIYGFSSYLEARVTDLSPETMLENLGHISQVSLKTTDIIDELLLLAQVRREAAVELCPIEMRTIVAQVQKRLGYLLTKYQAEMIVPSKWPLVWGYPAWVEEVWVNYISNACKYGGGPEEGIAPRVELGFDESDGLQVRFWVKDNGPGLSADQRAKLFVPFTRLHQTRAEGHGLGLSIVGRIVEKLGGEVGVESASGAGSTFWFTLLRSSDAEI